MNLVAMILRKKWDDGFFFTCWDLGLGIVYGSVYGREKNKKVKKHKRG